MRLQPLAIVYLKLVWITWHCLYVVLINFTFEFICVSRSQLVLHSYRYSSSATNFVSLPVQFDCWSWTIYWSSVHAWRFLVKFYCTYVYGVNRPACEETTIMCNYKPWRCQDLKFEKKLTSFWMQLFNHHMKTSVVWYWRTSVNMQLQCDWKFCHIQADNTVWLHHGRIPMLHWPAFSTHPIGRECLQRSKPSFTQQALRGFNFWLLTSSNRQDSSSLFQFSHTR